MTIILDIKKMIGAKTYEPFGYSIFPLFSNLVNDEDKQVEIYINSGIF